MCSSEFGHRPHLISFVNNQVGIRRSDGALINSGISPYIGLLHSHAASNNWDDALRLCRLIKVSPERINKLLYKCLTSPK